MDEIRKAGDYTIIKAMQIGEKELVIGENMNAADGNYYMTANYESNELFERYTNVVCSCDYVKVAAVFAQRLTEEVSRLQIGRCDMCMNILNENDCIPVGNETLTGKIIVLKPDILSPEYRNEHYQIMRCTGGNGARADGLGTSIFCTELYTGENMKYRRASVLGILKEDCYPAWLTDILDFEKDLNNPNKFQYGDKHFLPVGLIKENAGFQKTAEKTRTDKNLGYWCSKYESIYGKPKFEYNYNDFYTACGNKKCDVFKCIENGKYYLPAENELFEYEGSFDKYIEQNEKVKKKSHKEVER